MQPSNCVSAASTCVVLVFFLMAQGSYAKGVRQHYFFEDKNVAYYACNSFCAQKYDRECGHHSSGYNCHKQFGSFPNTWWDRYFFWGSSCPMGANDDGSCTDASSDPKSLGEGDGKSPCDKQGNPVDLSSANKIQKTVDWWGSGLHPLNWARTYNSLWPGDYNTNIFPQDIDERLKPKIGGGWISPLDAKIFFDGDKAIAYRSDGAVLRFPTLPADVGDEVGIPGVATRLVRQNSSEVRLEAQDGVTEIYQKVPGDSELWIISKQVSAKGLATNFYYSFSQTGPASYHLDRITNHYGDEGQTIRFGWTGDWSRIDHITFPDGSQVHYRYKHGRLEYVIYADVADLDLTDNNRLKYHYGEFASNSAPHTRLTGITDENGSRFASWTYDSRGFARSSDHAGEEAITVEYSVAEGYDGMATVTGPLGRESHWYFSAINGIRQVSRIEGEEIVGSCAPDFRNFSYYTEADGVSPAVTSLLKTKTAKSEAADGGPVTRFEYWDDGLEKRRTEAEGTADQRIIYTEWDHDLAMPTLERLEGVRQVETVYHDNGRVAVKTVTDLTAHQQPYVTHGRSRTWSYSYTWFDPGINSKLESIIIDGPLAGLEDVSRQYYSTHGYLEKTENALGHVTEVLAHDGAGRPKQIRNENGSLTTLSYHPRGWLEQSRVEADGLVAVTSWEYDAVGQVKAVTLPAGEKVFYEYDSAHRLYQTRDGTGNYIHYTLDAAGNIEDEQVFDAGGTLRRSIARDHDALSRIRSVVDGSDFEPVQVTSDFDYSVRDELTSRSQGSRPPISLHYDNLSRLRQIDHEDGFSSTYAYDAAGNLTQVTDQEGHITEYVYDGFGNLIQQRSPDSGVTTYWYDAAGNRVRSEDAKGVITEWTYDARNRVAAIEYPASPELNVWLGYDYQSATSRGAGRLSHFYDPSGGTGYQYDYLGRITHKNVVSLYGNPQYHQTRYSHDASGNLTQIVYPTGRVVEYQLDIATGNIGAVRLQRFQGAPVELVADGVTYVPFGSFESLTLANGQMMRRDWDTGSRLTSLQSGDVLDRDYAYRTDGNIARVEARASEPWTHYYLYDAAARLSAASGPYGFAFWSYDGVGNRTAISQLLEDLWVVDDYTYEIPDSPGGNRLYSISRDDGGEGAESYFWNDPAGAVKFRVELDGTAMFYDRADDGRIHWAVKWDGSINQRYQYNALAQRVARHDQVSGEIIKFHYDEAGKLLSETTAEGQPIRDYIWLDDTVIAVVDATTPPSVPGVSPDSSLYYVHTDHLGAPLAMSNQAGTVVWKAAYRPFGEVDLEEDPDGDGVAVTMPIRFPGQYHDEETGLYYNWHRYYDPRLGRYLSSDPIGLGGGVNTYSYAGGNPLINSDPLGLAYSPNGEHNVSRDSTKLPDKGHKDGSNSLPCRLKCAFDPTAAAATEATSSVMSKLGVLGVAYSKRVNTIGIVYGGASAMKCMRDCREKETPMCYPKL